jgi:hypothetical protein
MKHPFGSLAAYSQFIVYKLVPSETKAGKTDKLPIDYRTGGMPAKGSGASSIWTTLDGAMSAMQRLGTGYGVGFSFAESDPFWFMDIDNCIVDGDWSPLAKMMLGAFPGAFVEVSQSGKGLHIIGSGALPDHACKNVQLGLELYHADRFVALTGTHASGDPGAPFPHGLLVWLVDNYFAPKSGEAIGWTSAPDPLWNGPLDDATLISRMLRSQSAAAAFNKHRASFAALWNADEQVLRDAFPDDGRTYDASSADAALAQHLAFWTGKNCERMLSLMKQSKLYRDKWDREDYLPRTISGAVARQTEVLQDKPVQALTIEYETGDVASNPAEVTGSTYLNIAQQVEFFKGCVYVTDMHRVLTPGGILLKPEQFRVMYGGYSFPMDLANERTVRNAWECFTESQAISAPRANSTCFRPDLEPGAIVRQGGETLVNTWWPIQTERQVGDPEPFLNHLKKILPEERDRKIVLSYMAACVQHKGVKFQWAPLLQGVEGNGKTLLTMCVAFAVGERYTHFPKASQIAKNFNLWMYGKVFIGIEDMYVAESKEEVLEELKPMITGHRIEIEGKGVDQVTRGVCCNFILNSNHKGAVRKSRNDRRLAIFYTAQQRAEDLVRDGMTNGYFPRLYAWLKSGGYAIVNELLHTYEIDPEFNPANGHIAPITSSTDEAIINGLGSIEQEIVEATERGDAGFCGGWISSIAVDRLLEKIGASRRIPHNKRRELLNSIGYDYHPNLTDGRVNNMNMIDQGKPRLYIRADNPARSLTNAAQISAAYVAAQKSS